MRCGSAFVNKDNSINVYLDALPLVAQKDGHGVTIQLREYTEEEVRERAEKRATFTARGTLGNSLGASLDNFNAPAPSASADGVPF